MLAFDLETTGLVAREHDIICAGACDPASGFERTFIFPLGDDPEDFMRLLDEADRLCSFNGARFDIPFMQERWRVPAERVHRWRLKLHDVFEACRAAVGATFSLDALLKENGLPAKSGNGAWAVQLAAERDWDRLRAYGLDDARLTHMVSSLELIRLPRLPALVLDRSGCFRGA